MCVVGVGIEFRASLSWAHLCHWATSLPNMAYFCSWTRFSFHSFSYQWLFVLSFHKLQILEFFLLFFPCNLLYKLFFIKYLIIFLFCSSTLKHKQAFITLDTAGLFVSTLSFNLTIYPCQIPLKHHAPCYVPNLYYLLMAWHSISHMCCAALRFRGKRIGVKWKTGSGIKHWCWESRESLLSRGVIHSFDMLIRLITQRSPRLVFSQRPFWWRISLA